MNTKLNRFNDKKYHTDQEREFDVELENYYTKSIGSNIEKLYNFPKYVPRQPLARFLAKYEIFKKILHVQGSIIECGISFGGGLMTFAKLSAIFEPINFQRKIIGFDTFSGFPTLSKKDEGSETVHAVKGGHALDSYDDIMKSIELYDKNRFLNHMPKIQILTGDATKTIPDYLKNNPHTIVSLLYLDFDIYDPTRIAIENFISRMPKGAIIAFDQINAEAFKGESVALLDTLEIKNYRIERFTFDPYICYAVIQ